VKEVMRTLRTIRNCQVRMKVVCPRTWNSLSETAAPDVRHCSQCDSDVYYCATDEETLAHARAGHCVAREEPDEDELPRVVVGRPAQPIVYTEQEQEAGRLARREHGINAVLNGRLEASRVCPECGYPVLDFVKTCFVCSFEVGRVR
jgi:hypothetical protein